MLLAAPYVIEYEAKWDDILERHHIKKNIWKNMILDYENYVPEFNPNIIRYADELQFLESTGFFQFEKSPSKE
jgi:hypothetical protein